MLRTTSGSRLVLAEGCYPLSSDSLAFLELRVVTAIAAGLGVVASAHHSCVGHLVV